MNALGATLTAVQPSARLRARENAPEALCGPLCAATGHSRPGTPMPTAGDDR
jgi:hypothetical protein